MKRVPANIVLAVVGGGAVLVLIWIGATRLPVVSEQAGLEQRIAAGRAYIDAARAEQAKHMLVLEELETMAAATLGGELEVVDNELRTRLNRLGEASGLTNLSVATTGTTPRGTPARVQLRDRRERALRDEVDFVEVGATVRGRGTLAACLELVRRIEAEPWRKRVDMLRLDPADNGARVDVTVRLVTMFFPGIDPAEPPAHGVLDDAVVAADRALAEANPFRVPAPPPPVAVAANDPPPPPPGFPEKQWLVSGVVLGPGGPEVWMRNRRTGETRTLRIGDAIDRFEVAAAEGESVELAEGDGRYRLVVGQSLADRVAVTP